ncbi:MAG: peptidase [Saprospiraceae bacterium]|nr:peptidase [Saprospiraceae bacterium]
MKKKKSKTLLGRSDIVNFPLLELEEIPIKVDSGAYTSSFHCHSIVEKEHVLICEFLDPLHHKYVERKFTFDEYKQKNVKSSNGKIEKRFFIKTKISIFKKRYSIDLSLTERGSMRFPVLIGRKFLSRKFVVDTSKANLSFDGIIVNIKI